MRTSAVRSLLASSFVLLLAGFGCGGGATVETNVNAVPPTPPPVNSDIEADVNVNVSMDDEEPAGEVREIKVSMFDFGFEPKTIRVKKGERIKLTVTNTSGVHGIGIPAFNVSIKPAAGETKSQVFTADKVGTYPLFCNVFCGEGHKSMTGTLIVE